MTTNTKAWLHGLAAAVIGGTSGSIATIAVAPNDFNLSSLRGCIHILCVALVTGLVNAAAFLKQSPLPACPDSK